jgi:hypothetical protein
VYFQEIQYPIDLYHYGPPRTPGLHLSQILRAMAIHTGTFKDSVDLGEVISTIDPSAVGMSGPLMRCINGYAWENWLFKNVLKNATHQPGEFFLDGIIGTPDGIEEDLDWLTIHEAKWTFLSSNGPFSQRLQWLYQGACYLKMASTAYSTPLSQCRLIYHPCYVKGNYRGIDTEYRPVEVRMEQREVDGVWDVVSGHRNLVKEPEEGKA